MKSTAGGKRGTLLPCGTCSMSARRYRPNGVRGIFRHLTVLPCAVALGDHNESRLYPLACTLRIIAACTYNPLVRVKDLKVPSFTSRLAVRMPEYTVGKGLKFPILTSELSLPATEDALHERPAHLNTTYA